jgi:hypothetical protein
LPDFATTVSNDNGLKCSGTSVLNPQANEILERKHQNIGNIIGTFDIFADADLDLGQQY